MRRALAAVAVAAAALVGAAPEVSAAQTADPSVQLVSQTAWVADGGSFDLVLGIDGDLDDLEVQVTVHGRLGSRSAFAQSLEGRARGTTTQVVVPAADLPVDDGGRRRVVLALPEADAPAATATLPTLRQGVYPVTVALRDADGATEDRFMTHLVRTPDDDGLTPLAVAWVHPIAAPPALAPDDVLRDVHRRALQTSLQALATAPDLDLTIEPTPETLLRLDDELAPLHDALERGSQLLAAPYVDVDPRAMVAAGLAGDLTAQREAGDEALFATLGVRPDPRTWVADQLVTTATVARLRALGVTRLIVPEATLEPLDDELTSGTTLARPFELDAGGGQVVRAAAIDEDLRRHFRSGTDQVLAAHQFLADLAVLFFDFPGTTRGMVIRPPDQWTPSTAFLGTVLPAIADASILRSTTLDGLFDAVDPLEDGGDVVVRTPVTATRTTSLPADRFREAHAAVDRLAALVGRGDELVEELRARLLVSQSTRLRAADRDLLLASIVHERAEVEDRIRLPDSRSFRLTAREATIPLTLVNDNPFTVAVDVLLTSDKLEFTDAPPDSRARHFLRLDLEPGTHTYTVPVRARASGTFPVRAALLTVDGGVLRRGQFTITSSAFSGVGLVLSVGAGLFLLLWWASHWRTVRRDRRLVEAPK